MLPHVPLGQVGDLAVFLLTRPVSTLVIAVFIGLIWEAWSSHRARPGLVIAVSTPSMRRRYRSTLVVASIAAALIAIAHVAEWVVSGYVLQRADELAWLPYVFAPIIAVIGLGVMLSLIVMRGTTPPEEPTGIGVRRTWTTFSSRSDLIALAGVVLAVIVTVIAAGLASSPDALGRWNTVEIPIPNLDDVEPLVVGFFGWAYGVPVLIATAALVVVTFAVLQRNAARAYLRPESVPAERTVRRRVATASVRITTATLLLALAAAWRLIGWAGSTRGVEIMGENDGHPYEAVWRYAELSAVLGAVAPLIEVVAFTMLLLVAIRAPRIVADAVAGPQRQPERVR